VTRQRGASVAACPRVEKASVVAAMGKNTQGHRGGSGPAQGDDNPAAAAAPADGKVDGAFHSPAFLAAHIARLTSTDRVTWDDFKKKQMEDARKAALEAAQEDAATRECAATVCLPCAC
jgi:hypothetical protein